MNSDLPENVRNESTLEDDFINRVLSILEGHYAKEEFTIEDMADQVFMSRSQLFRKIKAMTGHSPSTFLRSFRLKKAKQLLFSRPDLNISEVAYSTGFSSPKYFSNVFLEGIWASANYGNSSRFIFYKRNLAFQKLPFPKTTINIDNATCNPHDLDDNKVSNLSTLRATFAA
ncbi:MAG: helix-turn-helix transcriptional regulator [Saprospiraceae bacterium]|nr:helix-turn-helix transcriptional regulator [Candidatus Brachybacter algidus]